MKKQIIETRRLQLLAGMINESQFNEAEEMDEMARTAGTGGAYTITPEGESLLRSLKAGGSLPMGIGINHLEILKFLYNAKKDGKRVQKIDYANLLGKKQPDVNKFFNTVEELGFARVESGEEYTEIIPYEPEEGWDTYFAEERKKDEARDFNVFFEKTPEWTKAMRIAQKFLDGKSFEELAKEYNVTRERIRQIVAKERRRYQKYMEE